jgi:hypothetical protein
VDFRHDVQAISRPSHVGEPRESPRTDGRLAEVDEVLLHQVCTNDRACRGDFAAGPCGGLFGPVLVPPSTGRGKPPREAAERVFAAAAGNQAR